MVYSDRLGLKNDNVMKHLAIIVSAVLMIVSPSFAQVVDRVYLRDGRSFDGFISEQVPGIELTVTTRNGNEVCNWHDVIKTEKISVGSEGKGIIEKITLTSGEVIEGKIIVQDIGNDIVLRLSSGTRRTVPVSEVAIISSEPISKEISLWEQVPLLDRIILKDGTSIEGFIVSRQMNDSVSILQKNRFKPKICHLADIDRYQKIINNDYCFDAGKSSHSEVKVNGKTVRLAEVCIDVDNVRITSNNIIQATVTEPLVIETSDLETEASVRMYKTKYDYGDDDNNIKPAYVFNALANPVAEAQLERRGDGNFRIQFTDIRKQGVYFIAFNGYESGILVELYK